jgi:hypothetical protein
MSLGARRLHSVKRQSRPLTQTLYNKQFVTAPARITFAYAEAHCTQQNAQISGEALQDHRTWQGFEVAFFATPSVVDEKRKAQTPACQSSARGRDGCGASKGKSAFRLKGRDDAPFGRRSPASHPPSSEIPEAATLLHLTDLFELSSYLS